MSVQRGCRMTCNSTRASMWTMKQVLFKDCNLKDAEDVLNMFHEKSLDLGYGGYVNSTYLGFVNCPCCYKKVDCMMWDGEEIYLEIDLDRERSSPIHWCELTVGFELDDLTQIVANTWRMELKAKRRLT